MTTSIRKILFLFLALSITLPTHAHIESEKTLLDMIHNNLKMDYNPHGKKTVIFPHVSNLRMVSTAVLTSLCITFLKACIKVGITSDLRRHEQDIAAIVGTLAAIPTVLCVISLIKLVIIKNSINPCVVIDYEGISFPNVHSNMKFYWHNEINNSLPIKKKYLPIKYSEFLDIMEYYSTGSKR